MDRRLLGRLGEKEAVRFLRKSGYRVRATNVRTPCGEIDIIAQHRREIVFVEVKTRSGPAYGSPSESVTSRKLSHLCRAAGIWMQENRYAGPYRFEVLSIVWGENPSCEIVPVE